MSFTSKFIEGIIQLIQIAYLGLQMIITLIVLMITKYIVYTNGKPDESFDIAMSILAGIALIVFSCKMILQLRGDYKRN